MNGAPPQLPEVPVPKQRLLSLDALRGLDMLCIIGGGDILIALARLWPGPVLDSLAVQFEHVEWEGLHLYDLIFPLFIFLSGTAIPFSLDSRLVRGDSRRKLWGKIMLRVVLLVILGIIYNGALAAKPADPRFPSVLGQIGVAWGIAASVHLLIRDNRIRFGILPAWLVAIAVLQLLVPVPGHGAGDLTASGSINSWLDRTLVPGRLHRGNFDPEGLLCCISAASVAMAGALAGTFLKRPSAFTWQTPAWLALAGAFSILLAALYGWFGYPPVKMLWTATFDLFAIGISTLLLALFFAIIDLARLQAWSFPLRVIGLNCLTIYLAARLVSFPEMSAFLLGRFAGLFGEADHLVILCGVVLLEWAVLYFLYRRQWFFRV
ncbi:MAG: DUF5009 domain-containing protein [Verrucomicrobiaceae bacterium]|nr:MAG: DUF5009 domain-containing protein [Verrucomicrobiaceae bacterium]